MDIINYDNVALFRRCIADYHNWVATHVDEPVSKSLRMRPYELEAFFNSMVELRNVADQVNPLIGKSIASLSDINKSLLKQAILMQLHRVSTDVEQRRALTNSPKLHELLGNEVIKVSELTSAAWFNQTDAYKTPRLTDFLTLEQASAHESHTFQKRQFDEKFHILTAPALFPSDVQYFRSTCNLRSRPLTLAFLDIDDFKEFNTTHGETKVDREVLPKFMSQLEAHIYSFGYAYRFGGDEYVVLLPNFPINMACHILEELQQALSQVDYFEVTTKPSVSIGVMEIGAECHLTDKECLAMAEKAKGEAKRLQKGSIYINTGTRPSECSYKKYSSAAD